MDDLIYYGQSNVVKVDDATDYVSNPLLRMKESRTKKTGTD